VIAIFVPLFMRKSIMSHGREAPSNHENRPSFLVKATVTKPVLYNERWTMNKKDNTLFIVYRLMFIVSK